MYLKDKHFLKLLHSLEWCGVLWGTRLTNRDALLWLRDWNKVFLGPLLHGADDVLHLRIACVPQHVDYLTQVLPEKHAHQECKLVKPTNYYILKKIYISPCCLLQNADYVIISC